MQFWINRLFLRLLLLLSASLFALATQAQSVNPAQDDFRLRVAAFTLSGVDQAQAHGLNLEEIKQRLALERARFAETMTVDELHQVADALTLFLRNRGYVFHTVYLPPQRVEGGVVEMRVKEGMLGGVHVINNTKLPDRRFDRPFQQYVGKILFGPAVEETVQALKAQNGFRIFAFYSRGKKGGEAFLNLRIDPDTKRTVAFKADNYGSPASGEHRLIAQYSEYQLTGRHDRLSLAVLYAVDDVANTYGSLSYQLPFGDLDYLWDLSASNNQFEVGDRFAALGLKGDASTIRTGFSYFSRHHPNARSSWRLGFYDKRNNIETDSITVADEQSQAISLQWSKTLQSAQRGAVFQSLLEYSYGEYQVDGQPDGDFNKVDFSALVAKGIGKGRLRNIWQLNARGQYTPDVLPSIEGLGLSGAYAVRGFAPGVFNADSAVLAALEWRLPNLLQASGARWRLEPFLFAEYAHGRKENILGDKRDGELSGAGFGLSFSWGGRFNAQVVGAKGLDGNIDGVKVEGDDQVLFEIRWQ
jgi:Hemolysin activation/secretion protein